MMKKTLMMMAIAACAVQAQAALTFKWAQSVTIQSGQTVEVTEWDPKGIGVVAKPADISYYSAYFLSASTWQSIAGNTDGSYTTMANWIKGTSNEAFLNNMAEITAKADHSATFNSTDGLMTTAPNNDHSYQYAVIFYNASADYDTEYAFQVAKMTDAQLGWQNMCMGYGRDVNNTSQWTYGGYQGIPEPTSGLLMLLGLAGLALKRKRA